MMNIKSFRAIFSLSLIGILSACSSVYTAEGQAKLAEFRRTIPTCQGSEDCNAKWEAAQLWVVKNSGIKIQNQSNVLIETYNPPNASVEVAARVTKEPLGGGKYQILVNLWCDNYIGCRFDTLDASLRFNREIATVKP